MNYRQCLGDLGSPSDLSLFLLFLPLSLLSLTVFLTYLLTSLSPFPFPLVVLYDLDVEALIRINQSITEILYNMKKIKKAYLDKKFVQAWQPMS